MTCNPLHIDVAQVNLRDYMLRDYMGKARHFKTFPQANIKKSTSH